MKNAERAAHVHHLPSALPAHCRRGAPRPAVRIPLGPSDRPRKGRQGRARRVVEQEQGGRNLGRPCPLRPGSDRRCGSKRSSASQQSPHSPDGAFTSSTSNSPHSSLPRWSRRRSHSSAGTTVSNASAADYALAPPHRAAPPGPPPPGRKHLHYRDVELGNAPAYRPVSSTRTPTAPRRHSSASLSREKAGAELEEQAALDEALAASLRDTETSKSNVSLFWEGFAVKLKGCR